MLKSNSRYLDQIFFKIHNNASLTNLTGLASLEQVGIANTFAADYAISIQNNASLTSLTGITALTLYGNLLVINNDQLTSFDGFENLTLRPAGDDSVGIERHSLIIENNDSLNSVNALFQNVQAGGFLYLRITGNPMLSQCNLISVCNSADLFLDWGPIHNLVEIYNNAPGCNNLQQVAAMCGFFCDPLGGYAEWNLSQEDIDNYDMIYSNAQCSNISIMANVNNLAGLSNQNIMTEYLTISGTNLESLDGLEGTEVVNTLEISGNPHLTDISAISNLKNIDFSLNTLKIENNSRLSDCNIPPVCDRIDLSYGLVINNNAMGCRNRNEVANLCMTDINCIPPTAMEVTVNSPESVIFNDTQGEPGDLYDIESSAYVGFNQTGVANLPAITMPYRVPFRLVPNYTYEFYARRICNETFSRWTGLFNFTVIPGSNVIIAPNPADRFAKIYGTSVSLVEVFDLNGQRVLKMNVINNEIYTEKLPEGQYILNLKTEEGSVIKRNLMIKR